LTIAGCFHCGEDECLKHFGFKAEGIVIPFHDMNGSPIMEANRPFARLRLYDATDSQKYHQRRGSGIHVYLPHTFATMPKGSRVFLVEGEFKALSLAEAGYAAVGLCGFTGAALRITGDVDRDHVLHPELVAVLEMHKPAQVIFLGDADVVLNAQFAVEAAKLRRLLFGSKKFSFIHRLTVAKLALDGSKGVDDLRQETNGAFKECFEAILASAYDVPAKITAAELFALLLKQEKAPVQRLVANQNHEGTRARIKLLQSTGQLWNTVAAPLELKPLLADLFAVSKTEVASLVRAATVGQQGEAA
jgi:hypothetical protein